MSKLKKASKPAREKSTRSGAGRKTAPGQVPDPLAGIEWTGHIEEDTQEETSALLQGFKERAANEQDRYRAATDSEFWFAVCFRTREQKEAFLKAMAWFEHGDKYLNGEFCAETLGIHLPGEDHVRFNLGRPDKRLNKLIRKT